MISKSTNQLDRDDVAQHIKALKLQIDRFERLYDEHDYVMGLKALNKIKKCEKLLRRYCKTTSLRQKVGKSLQEANGIEIQHLSEFNDQLADYSQEQTEILNRLLPSLLNIANNYEGLNIELDEGVVSCEARASDDNNIQNTLIEVDFTPEVDLGGKEDYKNFGFGNGIDELQLCPLLTNLFIVTPQPCVEDFEKITVVNFSIPFRINKRFIIKKEK